MPRWPGSASDQPTSFGGLSRSELMSRIRGAGNRSTELRMATLLRKAKLAGWRRHLPLPGRPDFAWPTERIVLFVDGCFWHGHGCVRNATPRTNVVAWETKLDRNRRRDRRNDRILRAGGWRVLHIWECALRKRAAREIRRIARALGR